ncbi:hypothetical protein [Bdellovibrio sp. GT3]|uniref:hypothetical protein n=1 Tax=Bdellovibrio sp. GT3 TaxID=3136282 RepID=UPI0030F1D055
MVDDKISEDINAISSEQIHQRLQTAIQNGSVSFVTELLAIEDMLPYLDKIFIASVSDFLNSQSLNLLRITAEAIGSGQDVFRIAHTLVQIFPNLNQVDPVSLLQFLKIYEEKTKNDLMSGQLFEPIRKRTATNKDWGLNLENVIFENNDKRFYSYLLATYLGFSDSDYNFGYDKIKSAYTSTVCELKAIGLRGLGLLSQLSDEHKAESFESLILGVDDKDEAVASNAAFALSRLYSENVELSKKRIALSKDADSSVRFELLRQIQFKQGELDSDDIEIVKNLCAYDLKLKGITDSLDSIIYFLLHKGYHNIAKEILTAWVSSHTFEVHKQYNFTELFDSSIFEMVKSKNLIETIITEWLNSDDFRFHHVLQEIASYMGGHGIKTVGLDLEFLKSLNDTDILYVVSKILGFIYDFDISISLVLSMLSLDPPSKKTVGLVTSVLIEQIGDNYLGKTLDRIDLELKASQEGTEKFIALSRAAGELKKRKDRLSALTSCIELMPNADHSSELNKAFNKSMAASMKQAREKSMLFKLVSHVAIREARSTFSFANGEYHEPSKMGSYSHGIELPKKDVLDEVGATFERSGFRLAKRGEE